MSTLGGGGGATAAAEGDAAGDGGAGMPEVLMVKAAIQ